jgi:competence protein ComEC
VIYFAWAVLTGILLALHPFWGAAFFLLLIILLFRKQISVKIQLLCISILLLSYTNTILHQHLNKSSLSSNQIHFQVLFNEQPDIDGNVFKSLSTVQNEKISLRYYISSKKEKAELYKIVPGMTCSVKGELVKPGGMRNPNSFDYQKYLNNNGINWIVDADEITLSSCNKNNHFYYKLLQWRQTSLLKVEKHFPAELIGVAQALLFGEKNNIEENTYEAYQSLGVVHLLAISGLHVGMLTSMIYYLLLRVGITKELSQWLLVGFLCVYIVVTGASSPVIRASGMMIILILTRKYLRSITVLDSFSLIFCIFLFLSPYSIYNVGFQLSFIVSFALILSSKVILQSFTSYIKGLFNVTIISQLASLPVIIYHYFEFSLVGFFTNLLYVPLFSIIVLPGVIFIFILLGISVPVAMFLLLILRYIITFTDKVSIFISEQSFSEIVLGRPPLVLIIGYVIAIFYLFYCWEKRRLTRGSILLVFTMCIQLGWNYYSPYGEVVFIDVGQGDSILIDLPYNDGTYLIDTGGNMKFPKEEWEERSKEFSVGKDVVLPVLKSKGIAVVDKLILTHSDLDHIGGAKDIIQGMLVKEVLISPNSLEKDAMTGVMEVTKGRNVKVKEMMSPKSWHTKHGSFQIVSPIDTHYEGNNDSIVIYSLMGGKKWLFTGDLEEKGEKNIMEKFKMNVDVLKVGHHGSNTSTSEELLDGLEPSIAIISAGVDNRFGHPHSDVLKRLSERNIDVYSTSVHGAVIYKFLGESGTFSGVLP